jgi:hypothetical protein
MFIISFYNYLAYDSIWLAIYLTLKLLFIFLHFSKDLALSIALKTRMNTQYWIAEPIQHMMWFLIYG